MDLESRQLETSHPRPIDRNRLAQSACSEPNPNAEVLALVRVKNPFDSSETVRRKKYLEHRYKVKHFCCVQGPRFLGGVRGVQEPIPAAQQQRDGYTLHKPVEKETNPEEEKTKCCFTSKLETVHSPC